MMLLAESLIRVLELWDQSHLDQLPDSLLQAQVPIVLVQILSRTLIARDFAGRGETCEPVEATAYAALTLKAISSLPWLGLLKEDIIAKIEQSQNTIRECMNSWNKNQYLWVEKVTYGSPLLSEAYCLAALTEIKPPYSWTSKVNNLVQILEKDEKTVTHLFRKVRCFQAEPAWKIRTCVAEGLAFLPQLRSSHVDVLGGEQLAKNEYLRFIPCTWVVVNLIHKLFLDTYLLWDMMVRTLSNFRVDEYMETTIAQLGESDMNEVKVAIQALCNQRNAEADQISGVVTLGAVNQPTSKYPAPSTVTSPQEPPPHQSAHPPSVANVQAALSSHIDTTLSHPRITCALEQDRSTLGTALFTFLNSHIDQSLTNALFLSQSQPPSSPAPQGRISHPFIRWLHTIAAPSVSAPFSFTFLACLTGGLSTPTARYLAVDFGARVANMSRMYNDLGSVARDRAEGNVNCVDFAELDEGRGVETAKRRLLELARYERDAASWVGTRLMGELRLGRGKDGRRKADAVRLFLGVAELYADLYEMRDLSNRLDSRSEGKGSG